MSTKKGILYMLTHTEIVLIKEVIEQLAALANPSEFSEGEVREALTLLNKIEPVSESKQDALLEDVDGVEA